MAFSLIPGSTTAIGSLPHRDAIAAVDFVLDSKVDIPFWPQLPRRDFREWMILQYGTDLPGFQLDAEKKRARVERGDDFVEALTQFYEKALDPASSFPLSPIHAAGYYAFVERLAKQADKPGIVKGHVTGPLTFALGLTLDDGRHLFADGDLRHACIQLLARNAGWQARQLGGLSTEGAVVYIDEPIYSALGTAAYLSVKPEDVLSSLSEVSTAIRAEGGLAGLHCCGNADWETVLSAYIDVLNFDAWGFAPKLAIYPGPIKAFLHRGGILAWGIVPTNEDVDAATEQTIADELDRAVADLVSRGVDSDQLCRQSILTPSCGCGSLTVDQTEKVFTLLAAAGEHWRSKMLPVSSAAV
jgi:hypothetical protein